MSIQPIVRFPDVRLRTAATDVVAFDAALQTLVDDLLDTMRAAPGIGITAPHIGITARVAVIELEASDGVRIYINPRVEWSSPETGSHEEGSVSMPGVTDEIVRPAKIRVAFQDVDGVSKSEEADGLLAVCLQHEIDQLDGIFWLDRLSKLRRDRLIKRFQKISRPA